MISNDASTRAANAREMLQIIWNRMGYSGQPGISESGLERGAEALAIALDSQALAAMQLQLERDCAAICPACAGKPDMSDEWVGRPVMLRGAYRHPWGMRGENGPGLEVGFYACKADLIRQAWAAAHPEESADA